MTTNAASISECCPKFDPSLWDEKVFEWESKRFVKERVITAFYMPINFGAVIARLSKKVQKVGADMPDWLCLSDHTSKWNMEILVAVDKEIPDAHNTTLSGRFMSKVYEGSFKDTGKWCKDFESYVKRNNSSIKKLYLWYTTCPKCARKYGKNYVVLFAEVE